MAQRSLKVQHPRSSPTEPDVHDARIRPARSLPGSSISGKGRVVGNHLLAKRDWSDAQLAKLIDAYPREKLGVFLTAD